eukprot:m.460848 g.460848  ORF g.460848 m.460848 type:complete len:150 (-) comp20345_c2_seq3:843-1292(-)
MRVRALSVCSKARVLLPRATAPRRENPCSTIDTTSIDTPSPAANGRRGDETDERRLEETFVVVSTFVLVSCAPVALAVPPKLSARRGDRLPVDVSGRPDSCSLYDAVWAVRYAAPKLEVGEAETPAGDPPAPWPSWSYSDDTTEEGLPN